MGENNFFLFLDDYYICFLIRKRYKFMIYTNYYNSPIGRITMASEGTALIGLWFEGQKYFADSIKEECTEKDLDIFDDTSRWLDIYFSGKEPDFTPKILITGTPFRKSVAEIMLTIPYGKTMTYGEIANVIAKEKGIAKMSAQAVGGAVGHNSISIIIPCHRVVGTNGSLTGYAGGLDKKIQLLKLEKTDKI